MHFGTCQKLHLLDNLTSQMHAKGISDCSNHSDKRGQDDQRFLKGKSETRSDFSLRFPPRESIWENVSSPRFGFKLNCSHAFLVILLCRTGIRLTLSDLIISFHPTPNLGFSSSISRFLEDNSHAQWSGECILMTYRVAT